MEIREFRERVSPGKKVLTEGKELTVLEVIKYRFDDGGFYFKCYLSDNYLIAEDEEMNVYILVKPVDVGLLARDMNDVEFDNKKFKFLYFAHAIAEEVWGKGRAEKNSGEKFWDYMAEDGSYLSLGIADGSNEKVDFYGKTLLPEKVSIK